MESHTFGLLLAVTVACCPVPTYGADADDDPTSSNKPTIYLDLRTNVARLPAGALPIGLGPSALLTALQSVPINGTGAIPPIDNALAFPARSALSVDLPFTADLSDTLSLYAGVSGSTTSLNGIDLSSLSLTSWNAGFQAVLHQQDGGALPTVTIQSTVTGSINSGLPTTTTLTSIIELDYALDKDETQGFIAGLQYTHIAMSSSIGQIRPSLIGYAGAYYQWPNNWKITARGGLQSFGGAQFLNLIDLPSFTQPVLRLDLDRLDDDDNRIFGISAEIMWTPKPVYQLTLRTPLYFGRN
ncbi:MAG: hypothetical protein M9932_01865 [Xanthobacteraceae bacterium]|nr:hypothetical protein [Xanthobacteraceae bacterium]